MARAKRPKGATHFAVCRWDVHMPEFVSEGMSTMVRGEVVARFAFASFEHTDDPRHVMATWIAGDAASAFGWLALDDSPPEACPHGEGSGCLLCGHYRSGPRPAD